jgi:hypothetical protein
MKLKIEAVGAKIMDNKALLAQSRANIEQNRLLVLSNYAAAMSGNQQLALHNMDDIFASRARILELFDFEGDDQARYVEAAKARSELDLLGHSANLNRQNLALNEKMIELNQQLIVINQEVMQLNQDMLEFNEENLSSNSELISGALNPQIVDAETVNDLIADNEKSVAELERLADENRQTVVDLLKKSKENRASALSNSGQISERKQLLYANRDDIAEMRKTVGKKVTYAQLIVGDSEE